MIYIIIESQFWLNFNEIWKQLRDFELRTNNPICISVWKWVESNCYLRTLIHSHNKRAENLSMISIASATWKFQHSSEIVWLLWFSCSLVTIVRFTICHVQHNKHSFCYFINCLWHDAYVLCMLLFVYLLAIKVKQTKYIVERL